MMKKAMLVSALIGLFSFGVLLAQEKKAAPADAKPAPEKKAKAAPAGGGDEVAVLDTKFGKIVIKFFPDKAPNHVKNFKELCKSGFYNGTKFHRVIPGFMIQGGDPNTKTDNRGSWGQGGNVGPDGKEKMLKAEFNDVHHARGIVSMARSNDPDSASSQFFICVADAGYLDKKYTAFGEVIEGMDVADKIVAVPTKGDQAIDPVAITKATVEKRGAKEAKPAK